MGLTSWVSRSLAVVQLWTESSFSSRVSMKSNSIFTTSTTDLKHSTDRQGQCWSSLYLNTKYSSWTLSGVFEGPTWDQPESCCELRVTKVVWFSVQTDPGLKVVLDCDLNVICREKIFSAQELHQTIRLDILTPGDGELLIHAFIIADAPLTEPQENYSSFRINCE